MRAMAVKILGGIFVGILINAANQSDFSGNELFKIW